MCYKGSKIHRVVPNGYFEGGLIKSRKGGAGTNESVFGGFFPDENYIVSNNRIGVLGMSKPGPHKNGSVFYVTLDKLPHFNRKYVAFGRVIEGLEVLRAIQDVECAYQRPVPDIVIEECGVISEVTAKRIETPHDTEEQEEEHKRPASHEKNEIRKSKLENADIATLMKKRDAVIKDIEKTKAELDSQLFCLKIIREIIERKETD
jgi:cyclophilin family peptidyl-prolyl cis-trans isomerase